MAPIETLLAERKYVRARITKIYNKVTIEFASLTAERKTYYYERMIELKTDIREVTRKINQLCTEDLENGMEPELEEEEVYEERVASIITLLKPQLGNSQRVNNVEATDSSNKLRLPTVTLPKYSNDSGESFEKFIFAFESIMSKHLLSQYVLLVYLKGQLKNGPLTLVESLEADKQTSIAAKQLLEEAFASPLTQQYEVVQRLSKLRLVPSDDVYQFISEMRSIISSFGSLNINIDTVI